MISLTPVVAVANIQVEFYLAEVCLYPDVPGAGSVFSSHPH